MRVAGDVVRMRQVLSASTGNATALRRPAAAHYDVVALRVEFQPDTTRFTTGDGTFEGDLFGGLQPVVDPLPHDAAYFGAHLAFLEDYVTRVSDGKTTVTTHLVPEVVRLSMPMGAYSPTGFEADSDEEMRKLAGLVEEAWRLADAQSDFDVSGFDPERTAFVLFHAGVGRDIELLGTTLDKTPQDLPSLFLDRPALDRLLGTPAIVFNGFPVDHTMIIPRTETRRAVDFIADEPFLLELSINGMLAASFFNYLGVPDLFSTTAGESAIGPFGLMDPLGIFAYRGLFPPEPMGWTRYYLGWTEPHDLRGTAPETVALRAASLPERSDLARAFISGAEYFLVENRHRDPEDDGLTLRVWKDGQVREQHVENGDETFNSLTIDGFIGGVVVGVDNYDWALPGGVDEDGNELNGGILIWHVDERRLLAGLPENRVNADPERRAIDLEEADGAQDLGFPSNNPFGPANDQGSPFDFFYEGNPVTVITQIGQEVRLYENRFGPDTYPSSATNEGGPSFIVLDAFSAPASEMTFTYRVEAEGGIAPAFTGTLPGPFETASSLLDVPAGAEEDGLLVHGRRSGPAASADSLWIVIPQEDRFRTDLRGYAPARPGRSSADRVVLLARDAETTRLVFAPSIELFTHVDPPSTRSLRLDAVHGLEPLSPVVLTGDLAAVLFGPPGDPVLVLGSLEGGVQVQPLDGDAVALVAADEDLAVAGRNGAGFVTGETRWSYGLGAAAEVGHPVFGRDRSGLVGVVPVVDEGRLLWLLADGTVEEVPVGAPMNRYPVLVDLDGDERLDVLTTAGDRLVAYSQAGAVVGGFPIALPAPVVAQPLVAELSGSGAWSILVAATDGYLYAFDTGDQGTMVSGFPLAVGARVEATPLLQEQTLYAVSIEGHLKSWTLEDVGDVWWGQLYGNAGNTSFVSLRVDSSPVPPSALLDAAETYNWPNPIRDGTTYLRYRTAEDARIDIMIVDAAGGLVEEIVIEDARGGVPGEYLWRTDVGSGLYFARITATASGGRTQTRVVKMAVIR